MKSRKRIVIMNQKVEGERKLLFRTRIPGYGGMPARGPEMRCGCMDAFHHWQSRMQPACRKTWSDWDQAGIRASSRTITRLPLDRDGGVQQIMYNSINHVGPGILHHHPTSTPRINKQWQWPHIQTLWILSLRRPWAPTRVTGVPRPALRRPRRAPYSVRRKGMI